MRDVGLAWFLAKGRIGFWMPQVFTNFYFCKNFAVVGVRTNDLFFTIKQLSAKTPNTNFKMKKLLNLLIFISLAIQIWAQNSAYDSKIEEAKNLAKAEKFAEAALAYSKAFEIFGWRGMTWDRFDAARVWAMSGGADSAFFNLQRIAERANYDDLQQLTTEPQLAPLHADPRWQPLCERVKLNGGTMVELAQKLKETHETDQKYRKMIDSVETKFGRKSPEMEQLWQTIGFHDSINEIFVCKILDSLGWLGSREIGERGASALFLVVQHAPLPTQEKYLPMMREAVKKGNARGSSLALLEDRVRMRNGKRQVYGSQVRSDPATGKKFFHPIEDVENVDSRRASVGLQPLAEYAQRFGFEWNAKAIEENKRLDPADAKN